MHRRWFDDSAIIETDDEDTASERRKFRTTQSAMLHQSIAAGEEQNYEQ